MYEKSRNFMFILLLGQFAIPGLKYIRFYKIIKLANLFLTAAFKVLKK